ncbi:unnamed protein product [Arabidopsis lyrata]|nr:unnamed protein product [Arabidopsis lyrata]
MGCLWPELEDEVGFLQTIFACDFLLPPRIVSGSLVFRLRPLDLRQRPSSTSISQVVPQFTFG